MNQEIIVEVIPERGATQELIVGTLAQLSTTPRDGLTVAYAKDALGGGRRFNYRPESDNLTPDGALVIQAQDGGYWVRILKGRESIDVAEFGAVYGTECHAAVQKALNHWSDITISGDIELSADLELYDGQTIRCINNPTIKRLGTGDRGVFYVGNLTAPVVDFNITYFDCEDVEEGDFEIEFTNQSDLDGFIEGEIISIIGGTYYNRSNALGTFRLHEYGGINVVDKIDYPNKKIRIKFALLYSFSNVRAGKLGEMTHYGTPAKAVKDIKILGYPNIEVPNTGKIFREGGGCINGYFEFGKITCGSAVFGNQFQYCRFHLREVFFERNAYEFGVLSTKNLCFMDYVECRNTPNETDKFPIRLSESSNHNILKINTLNLDEREGSFIFYRECQDNLLEINSLTGKRGYLASSAASVLNLGSQAHLPEPSPFNNNKFIIHRCFADIYYGVRVQDQGGKTGRIVVQFSKFDGNYERVVDVRGKNPVFVDCEFPVGAFMIQPVTEFEEIINCKIEGSILRPERILESGRYINLQRPITSNLRVFKKLTNVILDSTSDQNLVDTTTIKKGFNYNESLVIDLMAGMRGSGNKAPTYIRVVIAGQTAFEISVPEGDQPSDVRHLVVNGKIHFNSITAIHFSFMWNGSVSGGISNSFSIPSTIENDVLIETYGWRGDIDDVWQMRQFIITSKYI
jgi:hypothetical protein